MRFLLALVVFSLLLTSCNENRVFEDHTDPSGNLEWNKDEIIKFDVEIIDVSIKYNQILALRFATGYRYPSCDIEIVEKLPDGSEEIHEFQFATMNDKSYNGEVSGDIFDLEEVWRKDYTFPLKGIYHYEIRHTMQDAKIHMVMEVGMIVDRVKSEKRREK